MHYTATAALVVFIVLTGTAVAETALNKTGFKGGNDICLSEVIEMKEGKLNITSNTGTPPHLLCKEQHKDNKCKPGGTGYGTVKFTSITDKACEINKCDPDYKEKLTACMKGAGISSSNLHDAIDLSDPATARAALANLDPLSSADQAILAQTLENAGVQGITPDLVAEKPDAAKDLLGKIIDKDLPGAQAAARELGLNDDLKNVARLDPNNEDTLPPNAKPMAYNKWDDVSVGDTFEQPDRKDNSADTGDPNVNNMKKAIACLESACGNYNAVGPRVCNRYGCGSGYGKYQVMWFNIPSWTARSCGRTIHDPQEFLADTACQERVFETIFVGDHVPRCGSFAGAASAWHSGSCTPRVGSTDGYMATSNYVSKAQCYYNGQCNAPAYALTGYQGPMNRSPVANTFGNNYASPVGFPTQQYAPVSSAGPVAYSQPQLAPQPVLPPQPTLPPQPATSPGSVPGSAIAPTPVPATASIIVQPSEVVRGKPLIVSWTSAGVSTVTPCTLRMRVADKETLLDTKNAGSRTVPTSADSPTGKWTFLLKCTPVSSASGSSIEKEISATVK